MLYIFSDFKFPPVYYQQLHIDLGEKNSLLNGFEILSLETRSSKRTKIRALFWIQRVPMRRSLELITKSSSQDTHIHSLLH